jgi:formylglycine-generating enzyme required for sulfatase activity
MKRNLIIIVLISLNSLAYVKDHKPTIEWVSIPSGIFNMGSPATEVNRENDETQHLVTLSNFKISKKEITVAQFKDFVDASGYITDAEKGIGGYSGSVV